ncbi:hypothetical protein CB1_001022008 [Camelus ferus]|nr:hypothetical protein CB1_001022008 [Camelus ferus]
MTGTGVVTVPAGASGHQARKGPGGLRLLFRAPPAPQGRTHRRLVPGWGSFRGSSGSPQPSLSFPTSEISVKHIMQEWNFNAVLHWTSCGQTALPLSRFLAEQALAQLGKGLSVSVGARDSILSRSSLSLGKESSILAILPAPKPSPGAPSSESDEKIYPEPSPDKGAKPFCQQCCHSVGPSASPFPVLDSMRYF